jgi:thiol peroxidase
MPSSVTLKGNPVSVTGTEISTGDKAPDFTLHKSLVDKVTLGHFAGKTLIISVVPSLDTPTCDLQGKRFNKEAADLGDDAAVLVVSRDLPPAQARWCGANDATNITVASDHHVREFGNKYGCELPDFGILARAVFVVGKDGTVKYAEYVPEIADEPNYDAALAAAKG